jgi:hypothetical protein
MSATNAFDECFANVFDDNKGLENGRYNVEIFFDQTNRKKKK